MNKKKLIIIAMVFILLILIGGSTYAYWTWHFTNEYKTNVTFTVTPNFSCSADGGGNITKNDVELIPTFCTNDPYVIRRTITTNVVNNGSDHVYLDLWLKVNELGQELSNSQNFRYVLSTSDSSCSGDGIISSGTFNGKTANDRIDLLLNNTYITSARRTFYLYIWLDTPEDNRATMDQNFNFELQGECNDISPGISNNPVIDDTGLIPVKLSTSGDTVTTVAESDSSWYNYGKKRWANAVLVNENTHTRSYYLNNPNTVIPESDILAYYVWIPRYSYQVWAYDGNDSAGSPRTIPIRFIDTNTTDVAEKIGDWYTPPAFWWDNNSDGIREEVEELSGIWVGKFETSHTNYTSTSSSSLGCSYSSCTSDKYNNLRVLPNVRPLTNNLISNLFYASRAMGSNNNAFGLDSNFADIHMMKNSEWGAVAYLSNSKYGINDEIRVNNAHNVIYNGNTRTYLTGCGANASDTSFIDDCAIQYGTMSNASYPQSTTGNVTGIFDMSGGTYDYVMGVWNNDNNLGNAPFTGFSSSNPLPDSKYYDNYANPPFNGNNLTNFTQCTLANCGGHALYETKGWYGDDAFFVNSGCWWFMRGGNLYDTNRLAYMGIFSTGIAQGQDFGYGTMRLSLISTRGTIK